MKNVYTHAMESVEFSSCSKDLDSLWRNLWRLKVPLRFVTLFGVHVGISFLMGRIFDQKVSLIILFVDSVVVMSI